MPSKAPAKSTQESAPEPLYRVGEVAERLGLTLRTLKYYEELGLVTPQRTQSRYRLYTEADIHRLERISKMRGLGLSLQIIQSIFSQPHEVDDEGRQVLPQASLQLLHQDLEQQLEAVTDRIKAAEKDLRVARKLRRELEADLNYVEQRLSGKKVSELLRGSGQS